MSRAGAPQSAESAADAQSSSSEVTESTSTYKDTDSEVEENRQALATRVALATGTGHRHSLFVLRQHANSGASQSTVPSVAPSGSQPVISRREAVLAGGRSSLSDPTPLGTPSSAGQVTDEEEFPRVPGSLKLIFMNGSEETCDFDEMSTVGFARARAARHEKKTSLDIQLIHGQRTLTKDHAKLYQIADDKFFLSLTVIVSPETRLRRILFERIVEGYNTAWQTRHLL